MITFWGCNLAASHLLLMGALVGVFGVYVVQLAQKLAIFLMVPRGPDWTEKDDYWHSVVLRRIDEVNKTKAAQGNEAREGIDQGETLTSIVERVEESGSEESGSNKEGSGFNVNITEEKGE